MATVGKSAAKKSCQFKEICLAFFTCQFTAIFQKKIFKALQFFDDKSLLLKTRLQLRNNYVAAACLGSIVPLVKADLFKLSLTEYLDAIDSLAMAGSFKKSSHSIPRLR